MTEWRFYPPGIVPYISTSGFHAGRERAPHLEQWIHRDRLLKAAEFVHATDVRATVSDLGCGDGGLLSLLRDRDAWGYDFQPSNAAGWVERGVQAQALDVFGEHRDMVRLGDVSVVTEVLEHLDKPHAAIAWIGGTSRWVVASSPWNERPESHDACHVWAWDLDGYAALIGGGGYRIVRHETVGQFQVILGEGM